MKVNAYFRVKYNGSFAMTSYDTETGLLDGVPEELFKINPEDVVYYKENYEKIKFTQTDIFRTLTKYRMAYVIIEFNQIGYIVCFKELYKVISNTAGVIQRGTYTELESKSIFETPLRLLGITKEPVLSLAYQSYNTLLYALENYNLCCTSNGLVSYEDIKDCDTVELGQVLNGYVACVKDPKAYGQVFYNGEPKRIQLNANRITLLKEG